LPPGAQAGVTGRRSLQSQPRLEGSVAEWSIATVLKTVGPQGPVSSNLTASANSHFDRDPAR
jgi:hypothetical protein